MGGLSIWHLVAVGAVVFLLFGKGKFSGLMEDIAKGVKSLKTGLSDEPEKLNPPVVKEVHHYHDREQAGDESNRG